MRSVAVAWTLPAVAICWNWLRLESPHVELRRALAVALLALLPALAPTSRRRALALVPAVVLALRTAFGTFDPVEWGRTFERGFLAFYDVRLPFSPEQAQMESVILVAVLAASLAVAVALAAGRPAGAAAALVVGAGWPATLLPGSSLVRGAVILAAGLWLLTAGRVGARALALGGAAVLAALAAATSPAVARNAVLGWQTWDPYTRPDDPVGVRYVWDSDLRGLHWPKKETVVLRVKGPEQPRYWRATTLDSFGSRGWVEDLHPAFGPDTLLPRRAFAHRNQVRQEVTVAALSDFRLVGAPTPVEWDVTDDRIALSSSGVAFSEHGLHRGLSYIVWSWAPRPTPAELARSKAVYPWEIRGAGTGLEVEPGVAVPPFATPGRDRELERFFAEHRADPLVRDYRALADRARAVVGEPSTPYAAAVSLERWFRSGGGFRYDETPPGPRGTPVLVDFVTRTKAGYCQHFAGAMTLMLRYLGIPARVAAGFTSGTREGDTWTVTDHDAHTWVEVWFDGWGWLSFDPTPGRGRLAGTYTSASAAFDPASVARLLSERTSTTAKNLFAQKGLRDSSVQGEAAKTANRGVGATVAAPLRKHRDLLLLVLGGLAALAGAGVGIKNGLRRIRYRGGDPRSVARACRLELTAYLADQGIDAPPGATLEEVAALLQERLSVDGGRFATAATEARFAAPERAAEAAAAARTELRRLLRVVRSRLTRGRRLRGAFSLRSL